MEANQQEMYREIILDHSQAPRNRGKPASFEVTLDHKEADTGDHVTIWIQTRRNEIQSIHWEAQGSNILAASCSIMSQELAGKTIEAGHRIIRSFVIMLTGEREPDQSEDLGDAIALSGIRHLPARVRCASLPWRTAEAALKLLEGTSLNRP